MQAFSRHVVDSLTSGLATTDMSGRVVTFNRAAEAITGIAAGEAVGQAGDRGAAAAGVRSTACSARRTAAAEADAGRVRLTPGATAGRSRSG